MILQSRLMPDLLKKLPPLRGLPPDLHYQRPKKTKRTFNSIPPGWAYISHHTFQQTFSPPFPWREGVFMPSRDRTRLCKPDAFPKTLTCSENYAAFPTKSTPAEGDPEKRSMWEPSLDKHALSKRMRPSTKASGMLARAHICTQRAHIHKWGCFEHIHKWGCFERNLGPRGGVPLKAGSWPQQPPLSSGGGKDKLREPEPPALCSSQPCQNQRLQRCQGHAGLQALSTQEQ